MENKEDKATRFWGIYTPLGLKSGGAGLFLAGLASLSFAILYAQGLMHETLFIALIISLVFLGLFLIAFLLGVIGWLYLKKEEKNG